MQRTAALDGASRSMGSCDPDQPQQIVKDRVQLGWHDGHGHAAFVAMEPSRRPSNPRLSRPLSHLLSKVSGKPTCLAMPAEETSASRSQQEVARVIGLSWVGKCSRSRPSRSMTQASHRMWRPSTTWLTCLGGRCDLRQ